MGHFYYLNDDNQARPLYEVPYADPSRGMRPATIKDAKKVDGVPSPNTIMQVEAKPGLARWSDRLLLDAAWDCAALPYEEYLAESKAKHKELKEAAANEGTAIHAEIERVLQNLDYEPDRYVEIVAAATEWLEQSGIEVTGIEKYFVNHELGLGGMIDVVSTDPATVDWKSTTTKGKSDAEVTRYWKDKAPLIAAYNMGYHEILHVPSWNIYLSRDEPGRIIPHKFDNDQLEFGWKKFQHCYELWVMDKGFDPRENGRKS
jgi:hypothetical protein